MIWDEEVEVEAGAVPAGLAERRALALTATVSVPNVATA